MGFFASLSRRSTPDLIVLGLAVTVGFIIVSTMLTIAVAAALGNTGHIDEVADWIVKMCNTIVGSVFGYLAGRDPNSWNQPDDSNISNISDTPSLPPSSPDEPPEGA